MTSKGSTAILSSIKPDSLRKLDLSENRVGDDAVHILIKGIINRNSTLETVNLEHCYLSNRSAGKLCQTLLGN
jgi:Ran GTPase-activating protein (RanGAP) involved in mRNA processing and transport